MLTHSDPKLILPKSFPNKDDIKREKVRMKERQTHTKRERERECTEKVGLGFDQRTNGTSSWYASVSIATVESWKQK